MLCMRYNLHIPPVHSRSDLSKVDISLLLKQDEEEAQSTTTSVPAPSRSPSVSTTAVASTSSDSTPLTAVATVPTKRSQGVHPSESPAKKQSKWTPAEDKEITRLRGQGMKWEDISERIPGRSAISCRLHYQNYIERRCEWDDDRKNKLARLYERFKQQMWEMIAKEMSVPWRTAEAMHWQLGDEEIARRAGVTPFQLTIPRSTTAPDLARSHTRASSAAPRTRRESAPRTLQPHPPQLPSVAELTAGLPAYATQPPPFPQQYKTSPDYHGQPGEPQR